jgi:hypothetical protein
MTRSEFARALWRVVVRVDQELAKLRPSHARAGPSVEALSRRAFADVTPEHASDWGLDELAARGILNGYPNGTFAPRRSVTLGELAAALQRMLQWVDQELAEIKSAHGETQPGRAQRK